jgi:hypothetical protein
MLRLRRRVGTIGGIEVCSAGQPCCSRCPTRSRRIDPRIPWTRASLGSEDAATATGHPAKRPQQRGEREAVDRWRFEVKRLVLVFNKEKETKGTYRYQEVEVAERDTAVGSLYLKRRWLAIRHRRSFGSLSRPTRVRRSNVAAKGLQRLMALHGGRPDADVDVDKSRYTRLRPGCQRSNKRPMETAVIIPVP